MRTLAIYVLLAGSTSAIASVAHAQAADASPAAVADQGGVAEIVVTAQRRSQSLVSVPLSITAVTGATLAQTGVKSIGDLAVRTPGVSAYTGYAHNQVFIRGIGNTVFNGADPSVATFVDDVPRPYGMTHSNFVNVERVEILKGAQGGLYGRNATAGVINIITRQPSDKLAGEARVSYGSRDTFNAQAYINIPLTDKIAWNVSAQRMSHPPYSKNLARPYYSAANFPTSLNPGITPEQQQAAANLLNSGFRPPKGRNDQNFYAIDSKLRLQLTDNFKVTLMADVLRERSAGGTAVRNLLPQQNIGLLNTLIGLRVSPIVGYAGLKPYFPDNLEAKAGKWSGYYVTPSRIWQTEYGFGGKAELRLPGVDITSITAWRHLYNTFDAEIPAIEVPVTRADTSFWKTYFYQELRFVSTGSGPLEFLGGGTFFHDRTRLNSRTHSLEIFESAITRSIVKRNSWSVYGQVGYDILPRLKLTVSGRYVWEESKAQFQTPIVSKGGIVGKKFLPAATLSYKTDGGTLYARYAKGFKTGGIVPTLSPTLFPGGVGSTFKGEEVDTYEVGYRTNLFDRKVQFTSSIFYNDYKNLQISTNGNAANPGIIIAVLNAGSARTYGADATITWRVAKPLSISIAGAYLNAKYKKFSLSSSTIFAPFQLDNTRMINAPKFQASISADLDQPINDQFRLVGNLLWSHSSTNKLVNGTTILGPVYQDGYSLTNIRIGVRTTDDRYGVSLFVNNLFDKFYATGGSATASLGKYLIMGTPRIIGGELSVKF